ncbi:MAG: dynamin family protein [Selenomonadaceae bacterium]|nr:dynamin family protein [Selenomonadaceae bacterium]
MNLTWIKVPQIALCATMSAGKSTLINALLGNSYIPSSNFSCTAKIISLLNYSVGDDLIACKLTTDGKITEIPMRSYKTLRDWNNDMEISQIYLVGELMNIFVPIVLNDTPGTNSADNVEHIKITQNFLKEYVSNLIIFVINAEAIGTIDEKNLLIWLNAEIFEKYSVEIIFAVNKLDSFDSEREDISEVISGIKKYLSELGFQNFNIFPISTEAALLFRKLIKRKKFTRLENIRLKFLYDRFIEDDFQVSKDLKILPFTGEDEIISFRDENYKISDLYKAIQKTGICELENFINNKFREVR